MEATKIKAVLRAGKTNDTSQQILGAELRNVSEATAVALPSLNNMRRNINRFLIKVLNGVRNIGNEPEDILFDFERAAMNDITNQVNQVEVNTLFQIYC